MNRRLAALSLTAALSLAGAACSTPDNSTTLSTGGGETTTTEVATTTSPTTTEAEPALDADNIADQINERFQGFNPGELVVGADNVVFDGAPEERGIAAFVQGTLKSPRELSDHLTGDTLVSRAARERVATAIREAGYGDEEVRRALQGEGYFPIQMRVASQIAGTTYFQDGKVLYAGSMRAVGPNDVIWLYLSEDGKIIWGAAVRADCGNPNIDKVQPVRAGVTPPAPPVDVPPAVPNEPGDCPPWVPGEVPPGCPKYPQTEDQQQNGGRPVHGGGQGPQGNNGVDTGPTTDGNGNTIPEPEPTDPWNPGSGGGTGGGSGGGSNPITPDPTPGGHGGTGSGGTTPGGETCGGGSCTTSPSQPSVPPVQVPGEGGNNHDTDPEEGF